MEIYTNFRQKVDIEPIDVIQNLLDCSEGYRGWVFEKDGKYYRGYWESGGIHSWEASEEISKEKYEYVLALKSILKYLNDVKQTNIQ